MPPTVLPHISLVAETLFEIGPIHVTNSMVYMLIVMAALVLFFIFALRRRSLVPSGAQNFAEAIIEFLLGTAEGTAGKATGRRIFPLIATLFLFIIVANWSGLLPGVGTIGGCYRVAEGATEAAGGSLATPVSAGYCPGGTEFVPFLRAANADLNMTLAMALIAVITVQVAGIIAHGPGGYVKELVTPAFLAPIHIMGEISRVISLSFRLFGNIFGGEVLVTVMYVLLGSLFVGFGTVIFLGLELLFGFIQALLFAILTLVFISTAMASHAGGEGAHDAPHGSAQELGQRAAGYVTGGGGSAASGEHGDNKVGETAQHIGG